MTVVRINALSVPEGAGEMLEERFANRLQAVDQEPGFRRFELLRPTGDNENRYFVVTHWESAEHFDAWVASANFAKGHADSAKTPVSSGADLLEFDVVLSSTPQD